MVPQTVMKWSLQRKKKKISDSNMDSQQVPPDSCRPDRPVEIYRGPDSDQFPVPAYIKELMSLKVPTDLHDVAEILLKYHHVRDNDPNIKKFFKTLGKAGEESDSAISSKTSSSHSVDFGLSAISSKTSSSHSVDFGLSAISSKISSSHAGTVKVHKIVTGKTFGADEDLLKHLNCQELQVKMTDRQGCDIIILFCPIITRAGSDVELAMRQVSGEKRVILILMHHTRDVDYSTAAKRWSESFDNVVFDINVLFHETVPGLLRCPKNMEAISDIRKELMQYRTELMQYSCSTNGSIFTRNLPNLCFW